MLKVKAESFLSSLNNQMRMEILVEYCSWDGANVSHHWKGEDFTYGENLFTRALVDVQR